MRGILRGIFLTAFVFFMWDFKTELFEEDCTDYNECLVNRWTNDRNYRFYSTGTRDAKKFKKNIKEKSLCPNRQ